MSTTLTLLRQSIGYRTTQPFFREFGLGAATGGTTKTLVDTVKLVDIDDRWNGSFVYRLASQETRKISDFDQGTATATWLAAMTTFVSTDVYEIWSQFSPIDVHYAINAALRDAWPYFFSVEEKFLVIQADTGTEYSLAGLDPLPKRLCSVQMERLATSFTGTNTTTVAIGKLKDTNRTFVAADVGKEVRIYAGTSKGDNRIISAIDDANTISVSVDFSSILDTTSKYRVVDINDESHGYFSENAWSVEAIDDPTQLHLATHAYGYEGYVLRLLYEAEYPVLSNEADATTAPREYVELATMARLYLMKLTNAPAAEAETWEAAYKAFNQATQAFIAKSRFQHINTTWVDDQATISRVAPEYPFG